MAHSRLISALAVLALPAHVFGWQSEHSLFECEREPGLRVAAVPVRAMTPKLVAVDNLGPTNFELSQNHSERKICGFAHLRQPTSIGILLDASGSMTGGGCGMPGMTPRSTSWSNPLTIAAIAVDGLLSTSGPQDEYFLELINEHPMIQCGFTRDLGRIRAGLQVAFKGKSPIVDSIYLALGEMSKARYANRSLLVISDGCDNLSKHNLREVSRLISTLAVSLFFVTPGYQQEAQRTTAFPTGPKTAEAGLRDELFLSAERSGGYVFWIPNRGQMVSVAAQLATVARTPYLLYFNEPKTGAGKQSVVQLRVTGFQPRPVLVYGGSVRYPLD